MLELKRILVPTDFSEPSTKALAYGKALAGLFGGSLHVLHVIDARPFAGTPPAEGCVPELSEFATELETTARAAMARLAERAAPSGGAVVTEICWGRTHVEIARYAKERAIDLIVVGTHGRGFVGHLLLGSVAEKVVRTAPCPVLTVREREHDFVLPDPGLRPAFAPERPSQGDGRDA